ncbi:MAG: hypothetical protein Q9162_007763 [Coniocarpon cinnabarinum]
MAGSKIVLITGIGRGIGRALAEAYLLRPNHTVIGSVRDANASKYQELSQLPKGTGSRLVLVSIESTSHTDPQQAVKTIEEAGITHIDLVVANAGISPHPAPADNVDVKDVIETFHVNVAAQVLLYQAVKPLLDKSASPMWVTMSSAAGSIGRLEEQGASFVSAYGMSKAAVNWFTV